MDVQVPEETPEMKKLREYEEKQKKLEKEEKEIQQAIAEARANRNNPAMTVNDEQGYEIAAVKLQKYLDAKNSIRKESEIDPIVIVEHMDYAVPPYYFFRVRDTQGRDFVDYSAAVHISSGVVENTDMKTLGKIIDLLDITGSGSVSAFDLAEIVSCFFSASWYTDDARTYPVPTMTKTENGITLHYEAVMAHFLFDCSMTYRYKEEIPDLQCIEMH